MQLYIYARSGHNFGLENVRRTAAICNILKLNDPILCTADYRAATFAKSELGVGKGVGVDIIGNLPNVMERGDMLIVDDSGEASATMSEHMEQFCTHLYNVGVDIPFDIVDQRYVNDTSTKLQKAIFFADDDYANWFLDFCSNSQKQDISLVLGHYFFLGNEDKLKESFSEVLEEEEYIEIVKTTKYLLTASVNSCIESLASGNNPVFFKRKDKQQIENLDLIKKYNIPIIDAEKLDELYINFDKCINNYPKLNEYKRVNISNIKDEITDTLKKFEMIQPSLDYKF